MYFLTCRVDEKWNSMAMQYTEIQALAWVCLSHIIFLRHTVSYIVWSYTLIIHGRSIILQSRWVKGTTIKKIAQVKISVFQIVVPVWNKKVTGLLCTLRVLAFHQLLPEVLLASKKACKSQSQILEKTGALVCRRDFIIILPVFSVCVCSKPLWASSLQNEFCPDALPHSPTPLPALLSVWHPLLHQLGHYLGGTGSRRAMLSASMPYLG